MSPLAPENCALFMTGDRLQPLSVAYVLDLIIFGTGAAGAAGFVTPHDDCLVPGPKLGHIDLAAQACSNLGALHAQHIM